MRKKINFIFLLSLMSIIAFYSLRSSFSSGTGSGVFPILHFLAYFSLAGSFLLHYHDTEKGHFLAVLSAFLFGFCMEILQTKIPGRFFTFKDVLINLAGASIVILDHHSRLVTEIIKYEERILAKLFR